MFKVDCEVSRHIKITGIVQGVGFRPFVYHLAKSRGLRGMVRNTGEGVVIEVEGREDRLESFIRELTGSPPPLARIDECRIRPAPVRGFKDFEIIRSSGTATGEAVVPPDVAVCNRCRDELADPADRHYRYPFTNCTACGPRFTIVYDLPYDRVKTSMAGFPMCPDCAREYSDPEDRRFHAQPVACPACGPRVELVDRSGQRLAGNWLEESLRLLEEGKILAVKSLGGFHLACDASNGQAVAVLRRRKCRPAKPLAVMCRDLETVKEHCYVSGEEAALLSSPGAPIVILRKKPESPLPEALSPGLSTLGVMLPYTPLHLLLLSGRLPVLVMTSGNLSRLPLAAGNRQALEELGRLADYFLIHNRDIVNRCDDSVAAVIGGETHFFRRSRGYVPSPVEVPAGREVVVLGTGGEKKNTFCLLKEGRAYLSQHIGEMDILEGQRAFKESLAGFCRLIRAEPEAVACDMHPDYHVSRLARSLPARYRAEVQHHHAHMAACMAENGLEGPVVGIILDGTGYGVDGRIWGFEILRGDYLDFTREYHLAYTPLPGGERAVKNPWLTAVSYLVTFLGEQGQMAAGRLFPERAGELKIVEKMVDSGVNSPPASSCGRLFDAVSAILGVCRENTYEGQAAIELGELVPWFPSEKDTSFIKVKLNPYPFVIKGKAISPAAMLAEILDNLNRGMPPALVARRFHDTVAAMVVEAAGRVRERTGLNRVVLSGGCWHNRYLLGVAREVLRGKGFEVFYHRLVPPGDGGISLGQALVGYRRWKFSKEVE